jgi:gamma-D-glutamyl-L-lysine dipeptidyl-peptidase
LVSQQVFKFFGVPLLRDAYLQAGQGRAVDSLDEAQCGDLAFFQNEKGRVTHVGILLNNHEIIHASGRVRIDRLTKEGILNLETGKQTHVFHSIRRILL